MTGHQWGKLRWPPGDVLNDITVEVTAAQNFVPTFDNPGDPKHWTNKSTFDDCALHIEHRIDTSAFGAPSQELACDGAPKDATLRRKTSTQLLPSGEVAALQARISDLPGRLAKIKTALDPTPYAISDANYKDYTASISRLTDRQDGVTNALKAAQTMRATLLGHRDTLKDWTDQAAKLAPLELVVFHFELKQYDAPTWSGEQTGSAKLTSQTLLTKDTADAGTVAATWIHQPWEVSAGIMYSTVLGRSFQNSPVISAGVAQTDSSGKGVTAVTDSTTKPTIDALILVHYRFYERAAFSTRRLAILGSVGVGTGTNGSGADFAAGLSFAYGNLFISPLLHFTRDVRLTNGVTLGENLMGTNPPTERYWVHKFGLALTYAVPIT